MRRERNSELRKRLFAIFFLDFLFENLLTMLIVIWLISLEFLLRDLRKVRGKLIEFTCDFVQHWQCCSTLKSLIARTTAKLHSNNYAKILSGLGTINAFPSTLLSLSPSPIAGGLMFIHNGARLAFCLLANIRFAALPRLARPPASIHNNNISAHVMCRRAKASR